MIHRLHAAAALAAALSLSLAAAVPARAQAQSTPVHRDTVVTTRATGSFQVQLAPQETAAAPLGRLSIDKQFHGDLEATSKGEMLAFRSAVDGSAGYVAMEQVTGTLHGRSGTFVLQHTGVMDRGAPGLTITVVPDSGTGELAGLSGTMNIVIEGGKHSYELDYALAGTP
jgi:hypothetical protein